MQLSRYQNQYRLTAWAVARTHRAQPHTCNRSLSLNINKLLSRYAHSFGGRQLHLFIFPSMGSCVTARLSPAMQISTRIALRISEAGIWKSLCNGPKSIALCSSATHRSDCADCARVRNHLCKQIYDLLTDSRFTIKLLIHSWIMPVLTKRKER